MGHCTDPAAPSLSGLEASRAGMGALRPLDPRTRILAAGCFALVVVGLDRLALLAAALLLALLLAVLARLPLRRTLKRVMAMDAFVLFMLILLPFTTPGTPLFTLGPVTATEEGLRWALDIALTANAVMLAVLALVGGLDAVTLGHALHRLRMPESIVQLLQFTVRYVEVVEREFGRMRTAMRARGFVPGNDLHTYRTLGYALGMLLVRSLERSERVLYAMKCRGFVGRFHVIVELRFGMPDALLALLLSVLLAVLVLVEIRLGSAH
ncbi:cobalt ABC transporter, inner membrane subunit CbiQ [Thiorhodococcus drewsii AZ1]|uniref:Cobalt ABC transporter, inner membrane subunit CbiQ n=1 Tax=Thiorhodococcus drewsii AZ1 TaxID=765913 RepID=G2DZD8_9GAMM|nr:cobalt ECF transporter T component CbiQ [Thiorhodococcus drewsii]EGV32165.1 cobalt ABC transporter, inner membrane subunit CbiQ [Thiorhodococcus drewsii AZ1]